MNERSAEHVILLNICRCGQIRTSASSSGQANEKKLESLASTATATFSARLPVGLFVPLDTTTLATSHRTGLHIVDWWTRISVFTVMVFCKEAVRLVHLGFSPEALLFRVKCRLMNPHRRDFRLMRHV